MTFALFIGFVLVVFCTAGFRRCSEDQILVVCGMEANRKDFKAYMAEVRFCGL